MDAIQAAGAVPIDVQAMGIDFLACSAYKWLMGGRFGYLYVREDLQGSVLKAKLFGGRSTPKGASRYEISTVSHLGCVCQSQALAYIHAMAWSGSARTSALSPNACRKKCPRSDIQASRPLATRVQS